jgi:plasmid stabilization system protein ParE
MGYQIIILPQAENDILEAIGWMSQHSTEKATLWYFEIQQAIESLTNSPARCSFAPERETFGIEIRHLLFEKYRILFVIEDVSVYVLRVRHGAQMTLTPDENQ